MPAWPIAARSSNVYLVSMIFVSLKDLGSQHAELARKAEEGETVVVTQDGKPVFDLVPHKEEKKGGLDFEAGRAYLRSIGVTDPFPYIADDFDDPLPEDFLLRPLPPDPK